MQSFAAPALVGVAAGLLALAWGIRGWYVLTGFSLAAFVLGTVAVEFERGVMARRRMVHESPPRALVNLVAKNNRRYGGYIVHVGVALAFVAIIGSSFFKTEVKRSVREGQSFEIGPYRLVYLGLSSLDTAHMENLMARLSVMRHGKMVEVLEPAKLFYKRPQQPATKVAIRSTLGLRFYVVLAGVDDKSGLATFDVFLTPLVSWLWLGGMMMALGTVVGMWPNAREREADCGSGAPACQRVGAGTCRRSRRYLMRYLTPLTGDAAPVSRGVAAVRRLPPPRRRRPPSRRSARGSPANADAV